MDVPDDWTPPHGIERPVTGSGCLAPLCALAVLVPIAALLWWAVMSQ